MKAIGNSKSPCTIKPDTLKDLIWWRDTILVAKASLYPTPQADLTIFTDASNEGWGASTNDQTVNGRWNQKKKNTHK